MGYRSIPEMARILDQQPTACDGSVSLAKAALPLIFEGSGYGPAIARGVAASFIESGLPRLGSPGCYAVAGFLAVVALAPRSQP